VVIGCALLALLSRILFSFSSSALLCPLARGSMRQTGRFGSRKKLCGLTAVIRERKNKSKYYMPYWDLRDRGSLSKACKYYMPY
jgi:hypothetical protein